jgi:N-methylhydantoinase B
MSTYAPAAGAKDAVGVDPVTFEVIRNRLTAINEEQSLVLKMVSGSPVVTDASDFNVGLYLPDGSIVTMGLNVLYHAGSMSPVIANTLADCADNPGINEGDAFLCNDPYKGALHPPDLTLVEPIFFEGELVAWTGACAHELDVGGMDFGSWCPKATEVQQEGMILPPVKLIDGGEIRQDLWDLVLGMSRLPFILALDLKAMMAANRLAKERLGQLLERYGLDVVRAVMHGLLDRSERLFRERLSELPDGVFRGRNYLDHDGHENRLYTVQVELRKEGDQLVFDYTGTSPQAPGFVNCTGMGLRGGVYSGVFPILAAGLPWNHGILRAIEVVCPEGVLVNATRPAPCGSATLAAMWLAETVAVEAASRLAITSPVAAGEAHATTIGGLGLMTVGGLNQYGEPFGNTFTDQMAGGAGAYAHRVGTDYGGMHCNLTQQIPNVESLENFSPLIYLRRSTTTDSAGAGRHRGGAAAGASFVLHDAQFMEAILASHGVQVPNSTGLFGGSLGSCNRYRMRRGSDVRERWAAGELPEGVDGVEGALETYDAKPGRLVFGPEDVFEWTWQGGGGYGDALDAEPADVARDVAAGIVSTAAALDVYGVTLDGHGAVSEEATILRREAMRDARRPEGETERPYADAVRVATLTPYIGVVVATDGHEYACECGAALGPASGNPKRHMHHEELAPDQVGPLVVLHEELSLHRHSCPACGRTHAVEVLRDGDAPLDEAQLALEGRA